MKSKKHKVVAPYYAVALLWLACAVLLPLYTTAHYILLSVVSVVVFVVVKVICVTGSVAAAKKEPAAEKAAPKESASAEPAAPKTEEKNESTGDPALDKMIKDGRLAISEMKRLDNNIADPGISADIVRLEQVSQKIFDEVKQDPKKLPQIRRFMDYYLPTTLKLLNSYDRMSATGISGDNIDTTLAKVEGMMRTIVAAFEKQLDNLYGAEALDISTDIAVLETMMAREGLTDAPMGADDGIRLEL